MTEHKIEPLEIKDKQAASLDLRFPCYFEQTPEYGFLILCGDWGETSRRMDQYQLRELSEKCLEMAAALDGEPERLEAAQ